MRRSVNLETGQEEIEVLDAGDLAVERFSSDRPVTGPSPVRQCHHHDVRAGPSQHTTPAAAHEATPVLASRAVAPARDSRRRRALAVQSGVSRPAPMSLVKSA